MRKKRPNRAAGERILIDSSHRPGRAVILREESVTTLLAEWSRGDTQALQRLTPLVYEELRKLASHYLRNERQPHTLQTTALVNEAYLRMVRQDSVDWAGRSHFFGIAARLIRQILVDHARKRYAGKRDSGGP